MKKIFYSLTLVLSFVLFTYEAEALQCLYESKDGDKVAVYQFWLEGTFGGGEWIAYAEPFGDIEVNGETIKDSEYTDKVYNDIKNIDEWRYFATDCYEKLMYNVSSGQDEVYVCDEWEDCGKGDEKFYLIEASPEKTPNHVGLNEMVCTYEAQNTSGYIETYSFVIKMDMEKLSGTYSLWNNYDYLYDGDFTKDGINTTIMSPASSSYQSKSYFDSFTVRTFWHETDGYFMCPGEIAVTKECDINALLGSSDCAYYIGYSDSDSTEFKNSGGFLWSQISSKEFDVYKLANSASYIDYTSDYSDNGICAYTYEGKQCNPEISNCTPQIMLNLIKREFKNGTTQLLYDFNSAYGFSDGVLVNSTLGSTSYTSCEDLPTLYTDCLLNKRFGLFCSVSETYFEGSEKLVTNDWSNTQDITDVIEGMGYSNGNKYKTLICELSDRLVNYVDRATLNSFPKLSVFDDEADLKNEYSINSLDCDAWGISTGYRCNLETCGYATEEKVREIKDYCNEIYDRHLSNYDSSIYGNRKDECQSFNMFYDSLVKKGVIKDLTAGCDFISNELGEKLIWILDLLKIAGPILALGLGTLDFIKVIASGDSDKEMKNAFKRFSIRILAAILLFIIPVILAFLMDAFIGNQEGYDTDNPFCIDVYGGK